MDHKVNLTQKTTLMHKQFNPLESSVFLYKQLEHHLRALPVHLTNVYAFIFLLYSTSFVVLSDENKYFI